MSSYRCWPSAATARSVGFLLLLASHGIPVAAQEPPSIVRSTSEEVVLDLVVQDRNQRIVQDLQPSDVQVFEDGVCQEIKSLHLVRTPLTGGSNEEHADTPRHLDSRHSLQLVSLVFDQLDAGPRRMARQAMLDMLGQSLPVNALFSVFVLDRTPHLVQAFTNDQAALRETIMHVTSTGYAQYVNEADRVLTRSERNAMSASVNPPPTPSQAAMNNIMNEILRDELKDLQTVEGWRQMDGLATIVQALGRLPGRKTVIYLCEGLTTVRAGMTSKKPIQVLANENNVVFYPIDLRGLEVAPHPQEMLRTQSLDELAKETGGFAVMNSNDVRAPVRRIMEQTAIHYELSYAPQSQILDGSFRKIQVKLLRPGLTVQTRDGYFAVPTVAGQALKPYEVALLRALQNRATRRDLPFRSAILQFPAGHGATRCVAVFEAPVENLKATPDESRKTLRIHASFLALIRDASGEIVSKLDADAGWEAPREKADAFRSGTLTALRRFDLPSGMYTVETAALDQASEAIGTQRAVLNLPVTPSLGLSDIMLVRRVDPAEGRPDPTDPLRIRNQEVTPTLRDNLVFGTDAQATLYFVVGPAPEETVPMHLQIDLSGEDNRVLLRQESELSATQGPQPLLAQIPIKDLAAGQYLTTVTVSQGKLSARGEVLIRYLQQ